ncbi:MAG: hydrogenase maturation nickel metallochaperone HypA [Bacteroidota bacterium]
MHELSIVMSIVDIAEEEAKKNNVTHFDEIELQIGTLAGIEFSALEFSWLPGTKNSVLEDAELTIDKIQAQGRCMDCEEEFDIDNFFTQCPKCGSYLVEVFQGKELKVKRLIARLQDVKS